MISRRPPHCTTATFPPGQRRAAASDRDLPENERYGYVFEGNSEAIDHILVSPGLARVPVEYAVGRVNAEFAERASDHDPQVARFALP